MVESIGSSPIKETPSEQIPIKKDPSLEKAHKAASQDLGILGTGSKMQGTTKKLTPNERAKKLGEAIEELANAIARRITESQLARVLKAASPDYRKKIENEREQQVSDILQEYQNVKQWMPDYQEPTGLSPQEMDPAMHHAQELDFIRDRLIQIREKKHDASQPTAIPQDISDELLERLHGLLEEEKQVDRELKQILGEFQNIQKWISDFEKSPPPKADDMDYHQHSIAVIRDHLQQMRDQAEAFEDQEAKTAVLTIANELALRLDELLTDKFDLAAFLDIEKKEPSHAEILAMSDDELVDYLAHYEAPTNEEKVPEGEIPDQFPLSSDPEESDESQKI